MKAQTVHTLQIVDYWVKKGYWGREVLGDIFDQSVAKHPDKVALIVDDKRVTYAELGQMVNRVALGLIERDIKHSDYVIVELYNCLEYAYMHFALAKIGAAIVPVVHTYGQADLEYVINLCEADALVIPAQYGTRDYLSMVKEIRPKYPHLKHIFVLGSSAPEGMIPFDALLNDPIEKRYPKDYLSKLRPAGTDIVRIHLTAGTTGVPKALLLTHNDDVCNLKWNVPGHNWGEMLLSYFPLVHATGHLVGLQLQVMLGRTLIMTTKRFDPREMLSTVEREKVTSVYMPLPYLFELKEALEQDDKLLEKYNIASLKALVFGGVPPHRETVEYLRAKLRRPILQTYGMGEGVATMSRIDDTPEAQTYSVGPLLCPAGELKVIDDDGKTLPGGAVGELCYRGPFTFGGYLKNPEVTRQTIDKEGFVHTGDVVRLDEKGNIWIVGRKKDIIRRGGEGIPVAEVEDLIAQHLSVAEVAIVAMPDPKMGEKACAYVRPKKGQRFTFEDMIDFLKTKNIAKFKWPERLEIVEDFPRDTRKGGILKRELREDIARKLKAEGKI